MTSSTISKNQDQYSFDVAALVSILRKRIILIILVTLTPFLISVFWVLSRPAVYVSELQLLALKFNDQKNIIINSSGEAVISKREGFYEPADTSVIKNILLSKDLMKTVNDTLGAKNNVVLKVLQPPGLNGVIKLVVKSNSPVIAMNSGQVIIRELGEFAHAIGYLPTPDILNKEFNEKLSSPSFIIRLLETPSKAVKAPKNKRPVIFSLLLGFSFGTFLALFLEHFSIERTNNE